MAKTPRAAKGKAAAPAVAAPTGAAQIADAAAQAAADQTAAGAAAQAAADAAAKAKADEEDEAEEGFDFAGKAIKVVSVSGNPRRRAYRVFAREAVEIEADDLTEEELGAILADPQLRVSVV
ncbi:MAG: hypothetical protein U9R07_17270 [Pseudomonadota bacterium]|nr:hypothetical protein [Pseudomonadota bacterium]